MFLEPQTRSGDLDVVLFKVPVSCRSYEADSFVDLGPVCTIVLNNALKPKSPRTRPISTLHAFRSVLPDLNGEELAMAVLGQ